MCHKFSGSIQRRSNELILLHAKPAVIAAAVNSGCYGDPPSGRFTHISSASDAALEIGLYYYNHYPLTPYTTPVVSDPFADYGRAGAYTTPVASDPFAGYGRAGAYTTLSDP